MRISEWSSDVCSSDLRSGEHTLHPLEIGDLRAHIRKVRRGDVAHLGAGSLASSRELEQRPHLVEGETELSGPEHDAEAPSILLAIIAVETAPEANLEDVVQAIIATRYHVDDCAAGRVDALLSSCLCH